MKNSTLVLLLMVISGCASGPSPTQPGPADMAGDPAERAPLFEIVPRTNPKVFVGYLPDKQTRGNKQWILEDRDGLAVVDGDIVLGKASELSRPGTPKSLRYIHSNLWSNGIVPFELPEKFKNRTVVLSALDEFRAKTKVRFIPRTTEVDFLAFVETNDPNIGGQSYYGVQGGKQPLWLNVDTSKWSRGTVIHELCHALSFAHEQCRSDRDKYVTIYRENILDGYDSQFTQLFGSGEDVGDYDYASVMHYPSKAFSKNGLATILPKSLGASIGQRDGLSDKDAAAINRTYFPQP